ncbi:MAG: alpha/beta fold hydrolase [Candidatus Didemnitutus sp.]|nr:alpha/beta fold hydrolase [Candidatus Didemnitutus sp.]
MSGILLEAAARRGLPVPPLPHDAAVLGELAAEIFVLPSREGRRMPREETYLESAQRFTISTPAGELAAWQWGPAAGPLVGLVHGWGGHGAQLGAFVGPLVTAGFRVLTFDAPGHGDTPGNETHVPLLARTLVGIERTMGPFFALIGHSMGAAGAAMICTLGSQPRGLVLLAPPLSQLERVTRVAGRLGLSDEVRAAFLAAVERRTAAKYPEVDLRVLARFAPCPLLVFHDPADTDTSFAGSEEIVGLWTGSRLVPCPGRGHYRILATPDIVRQAAEFISGLR